jgi:hypothetical protein
LESVAVLGHLCSLAARYPKVDRLALATGVLVLLMSAAYPWVEGWASNAMVSFSLLASLVLTFVLAGLAWRRGDPVGGWVLLAYAPLALTIVVVVVRLYGWITASWLTSTPVRRPRRWPCRFCWGRSMRVRVTAMACAPA